MKKSKWVTKIQKKSQMFFKNVSKKFRTGARWISYFWIFFFSNFWFLDRWGKDPSLYGGSGANYRRMEGYPVGEGRWSGEAIIWV